MLEIHNLGEHSHLSSLVDLLLRHASGDLARSALHTDNHSIRELMLIAAVLVHAHNDGLLTGILARQNDNNLSGLKTLDHLRTFKTKKQIIPLIQPEILESNNGDCRKEQTSDEHMRPQSRVVLWELTIEIQIGLLSNMEVFELIESVEHRENRE